MIRNNRAFQSNTRNVGLRRENRGDKTPVELFFSAAAQIYELGINQ